MSNYEMKYMALLVTVAWGAWREDRRVALAIVVAIWHNMPREQDGDDMI